LSLGLGSEDLDLVDPVCLGACMRNVLFVVKNASIIVLMDAYTAMLEPCVGKISWL